MSLQFILGGAGSGKANFLYRKICEEASKNPKKRFFVLVPEQFTLETQKTLVKLSPGHGIMNIDVLSFNRLAYRVFEEFPALKKTILEDMGKTMVLQKILSQEKRNLHYFGRGIEKPGFLDELKRLARPYEDEEEEEEFDDFEPVSRSERMDRTGGDRLERKAPKAQDSTGPIFPVENERRSNKVVNIHTTTQLQVVLVKPERFENASEIADHLREKRTVVLNLESTNKDIARRLLDFLSGVAYANEGKIKKVAISTYIITPYNVDILGDLIDELENNGLYF